MIEVQFFIPVSDNQGQTFSAPTDDAFRVELVRLFGGFSMLPGLVAGGWVENGTLYVDQSRIFVVALPSIVAGWKVGEAANFAKANYGQLNIYIRYLALSEIL